MLKTDQSVLDFVDEIKEYLPGNSIDCVVFGFDAQKLKVLLLEWKDEEAWCLPGGFIKNTESMDEAAHRILHQRTGLNSIFLNQFFTFGNTDRYGPKFKDHIKKTQKVLRNKGVSDKKTLNWIASRFITTGYFALVDLRKTHPQPDFFSKSCQWIAIDELPSLIIDHNNIVVTALEHLKVQLNYLPIGISLLPAKFTMQDLQKLYEAILQKPLERSNFQRKMLKLEIFIRLEKQMTGAANKAPYLYSFDTEKYNQLLEKGIGFTY